MIALFDQNKQTWHFAKYSIRENVVTVSSEMNILRICLLTL